MNYNKKRMIVALHLTVSSVMLLSGFTSPGTKMNTAGDLRYAGGEIAVQIGDSVVDGTISMIKGTKQVSQSVQTAGDVWKTEAVRIEEMIRAEEERAAEEARMFRKGALYGDHPHDRLWKRHSWKRRMLWQGSRNFLPLLSIAKREISHMKVRLQSEQL